MTTYCCCSGCTSHTVRVLFAHHQLTFATYEGQFLLAFVEGWVADY